MRAERGGGFHVSPQTGSSSAPGWQRSSPGIPSPPPDCQPPPGYTPRQQRCRTPAGSSSRSSPPGSTPPPPERLPRPPEEDTKPVGTKYGFRSVEMEEGEQGQAGNGCQGVNLGWRIKPRAASKSVPLIKRHTDRKCLREVLLFHSHQGQNESPTGHRRIRLCFNH